MRNLLLALPLVGSASAALVEHWWNVSYAQANPDQLFERRVIGVNGSWPPPPVTVNQNDTLLIHIYNGLDQPTSLHAHGIFFNQSSYYDGAVGVTQCGIPPGQTLTYNVPTNLQSGTYWMHSHNLGQYVDGFRTPFVIHPAVNAAVYDDEYTIVLGDWYHDEHSVLIDQFLNWKNPTGAEPVPNSALVYVFHNQTLMVTNAELSSGTQVGDSAVVPVVPGKKYRLRVINTSALAMFFFSIDGHQLQVIEVDGVETEPLPVEVVPIAVAQRYSFLLTALNDTTSNYAIIANMDPDMFDGVPDDLQLNYTAQIVYTPGAPLVGPTIFDTYPDFEELDLVPVEVMGAAPVDTSIDINAFFDTYSDGTNRASFNNITYQSPIVPSIFTELTLGNDSLLPQVYGAQTNAFILDHLNNIDITIFNWDSGKHPFHLHGHKFQIVGKNLDASVSQRIVEGQVNPVRRDTVMAPPGGSITIRFRADNPGAWFLHCHIEWHLESGLAVTLLEAPLQAQSIIQVPQDIIDQCKMQNVPVSGNVVGLDSTTDFKGEPLGPFPQVLGWTPKAKGALAGSVLSALLGMAAVVWYSMGALEDHEIEDEARRKFEAKQARGGKFGPVKKLFNRQQ